MMERSVLGLHALLLVGFALVTVLPLLLDDTPTDAALLRLLVAGLEVLVAVDIVARGERLSQLVVLLGVTCVAPLLQEHPVPGDVSDGLAFAAVALSAVRLLRGVWYLALMPAIGGLYVLASSLTAGSLHEISGPDDVVLSIAMVFSAGAFADALEGSTRRAILAGEEATRVEQELVARRVEERTIDAARRVLHDEVLAALRHVDEGTLSPDQIRAASREAVHAVHGVVNPS